jgi:hypothetical protein
MAREIAELQRDLPGRRLYVGESNRKILSGNG